MEAYNYAGSMSKRAWMVPAAILHEAQQRSIHGKRSLEAIARRFEIGLRQAEKYSLVWNTLFAGEDHEENVNVDVFSLQEPSWYVVAATSWIHTPWAARSPIGTTGDTKPLPTIERMKSIPSIPAMALKVRLPLDERDAYIEADVFHRQC